jgi:hypothetical protein
MAPIYSLKERRPSADGAPSISIAFPVYEVNADAIAAGAEEERARDPCAGVTSASIARTLDMRQSNSIDIQTQDSIGPGDTRLAPDLAAGAGPCADGEVKDGRPRDAAALAGDNGGGTSGNHGNGTAG